MYKILDKRCEEHYIIKEEDGYLTIYLQDENQDLTFYEKTDISVEYLPQMDREELTEGIFVHGKTKLEKILEDYNS